MKPLFIFSLPRSGSTLLQRILAAHSDISTVAEPWLLLPYLYALKEKGIFSEYHHKESRKAFNDFFGALPNGKDDYLDEMRLFVTRLYEKAAKKNSIYFLDKTPRYHLVVDEIINLFPDAKFIFLWRNPLAICASIQETWCHGKWNLYSHKIDLYAGLENLVSTYERYKDRLCSIRFEDLLINPEEQVNKIFNYLELPCKSNVLERFSDIKLSGCMGDPTGVIQYSDLQSGPLDKWKKTLNNPVRKAWCRRYLMWIGVQRLQTMGYNLEALLEDLKNTNLGLKFTGSDLLRIGFGVGCCLFEPRIMKMKLKSFMKGEKIYYHM